MKGGRRIKSASSELGHIMDLHNTLTINRALLLGLRMGARKREYDREDEIAVVLTQLMRLAPAQ
jgi:hypothetical protein